MSAQKNRLMYIQNKGQVMCDTWHPTSCAVSIECMFGSTNKTSGAFFFRYVNLRSKLGTSGSYEETHAIIRVVKCAGWWKLEKKKKKGGKKRRFSA